MGEPDSREWDAEGEEYQADWIEGYTGAPAPTGSAQPQAGAGTVRSGGAGRP
jgi:hypothetical protein